MWSFLVLALLAVDPKIAPNVRLALVQISGLTLSQTSVSGGASVTGSVTLAQPAGANGVTVKFASSSPAIAAVPSSVVVQPGTTSATFIVQTYPPTQNPNVVTGPPSADISAQAGTSTKAVKLTIIPPTLASVSFNPSSVAGSTAATGQVTLTGPAAAGGVTIALAVAKPDASRLDALMVMRLQQPPVTLPPQVVVPVGAASATFSVPTKSVVAATPVQINATYGPFVTKSATLTVLPPAVASLTNTGGPGGEPMSQTLTLTAAAPPEGMTIPLSIVDTNTFVTCGPPPSIAPVQVAGGSTSATFPVITVPSTGRYKASSGPVAGYIFVTEALLDANSLEFPTSVKGGTAIQATLKMRGKVSTCGFGGHHQMKSSDTTLAQVPSQVTVPLGTNAGAFTITTSAVPNNRTVTISVYGNRNNMYQWVDKTLTLTP